VVLETLGAEDYGIYNVVAGVVTMFGFLSGAMATASQRYFSFEIGKGDFDQLKRTFSITLLIYVLIGLLFLTLAETIGLWFVDTRLIVPAERVNTAQWIYQFAILSFLMTMITTPYMALIIAHENMNIYAYVSIFEVVIKLVIVYLLQHFAMDKLKLYSFLMFAVTSLNMVVYLVICIKKYAECRFRFYWNKKLFSEILRFTGWSLFGQLSVVFRNQAITILLNQLFNPVVVAARTIAIQVNSAVNSFSSNFNTGLYPPIVKSYASGDRDQMFDLIFKGAKITYFLMFLLSLPLILRMPEILSLWLKNPPEHAVVFTRLALVDSLITSISLPLMTVVRATGKVQLYELLLGSLLIASFFISWVILTIGVPAYSVMIVAIIITTIMFIVRLLIVRKLIQLPIMQFFKEVCIPGLTVTIIASVLSGIISRVLPYGFFSLCSTLFFSILISSVCIYVIGMNREEKQQIKNIIRSRVFHVS
jgi:O-antigen/teichoic acid export membrane protein